MNPIDTYERIEGRWYIKPLKLRRLRVDVQQRSKEISHAG